MLVPGAALLLPGVANALAARVVADQDFAAAYVTGAGIANTFFGVPDIGLVTVSELAAHVAAIRDVFSGPLVVDADTGFGNAVNMVRTVQLLERAGADALQIEDQVFPKRCGHFAGKEVIPTEEMVGKIKAAVDARHDGDLLIIARTDAIAPEGFAAALERAAANGEKVRDGQRRAIALGVPVAVGTDATVIPYGLDAREVAAMTELGLTPLQALQAATTRAAEMLGWSDRVRSLAPGHFADLGALEKVALVVKGGAVVREPSAASPPAAPAPPPAPSPSASR